MLINVEQVRKTIGSKTLKVFKVKTVECSCQSVLKMASGQDKVQLEVFSALFQSALCGHYELSVNYDNYVKEEVDKTASTYFR